MGLILTAINLFIIFVVRKSNFVIKFLDKLVLRISKSKIMTRGANIIVYNNFGNEVIAEVELSNMKSGMKNKSLKTLQLKQKFNIQILLIKRNEEIIESVNASTVLKEEDVLVVFGELKNIKKAFIRREKNNNIKNDE